MTEPSPAGRLFQPSKSHRLEIPRILVPATHPGTRKSLEAALRNAWSSSSLVATGRTGNSNLTADLCLIVQYYEYIVPSILPAGRRRSSCARLSQGATYDYAVLLELCGLAHSLLPRVSIRAKRRYCCDRSCRDLSSGAHCALRTAAAAVFMKGACGIGSRTPFMNTAAACAPFITMRRNMFARTCLLDGSLVPVCVCTCALWCL